MLTGQRVYSNGGHGTMLETNKYCIGSFLIYVNDVDTRSLHPGSYCLLGLLTCSMTTSSAHTILRRPSI